MSNDYTLFWLYNEASCSNLSTFAVRLLNTIANSVPSERVWSNINYIHSKAQNSLSLDKVDKLLFIYNNSQVLKQLGIDNLINTEQLA